MSFKLYHLILETSLSKVKGCLMTLASFTSVANFSTLTSTQLEQCSNPGQAAWFSKPFALGLAASPHYKPDKKQPQVIVPTHEYSNVWNSPVTLVYCFSIWFHLNYPHKS